MSDLIVIMVGTGSITERRSIDLLPVLRIYTSQVNGSLHDTCLDKPYCFRDVSRKEWEERNSQTLGVSTVCSLTNMVLFSVFALDFRAEICSQRIGNALQTPEVKFDRPRSFITIYDEFPSPSRLAQSNEFVLAVKRHVRQTSH